MSPIINPDQVREMIRTLDNQSNDLHTAWLKAKRHAEHLEALHRSHQNRRALLKEMLDAEEECQLATEALSVEKTQAGDGEELVGELGPIPQ